MKKIISFIILFCSLSIILYSQVLEKKLIKISGDVTSLLPVLQDHELDIYHITEHEIFAGISSEQLKVIQKLKMGYEILDENMQQGIFYLCEKKTGRNAQQVLPGKLLWQEEKSVIIKTESDEYNNNTLDSYSLVRLGRKPLILSQNKIIATKNHSVQSDTMIRRLITYVSTDSIRKTVQRLQDFQTRFLFAVNRDTVSRWIQNEFLKYGVSDVVLDSFYLAANWASIPYSTWQKNIVATIPGTKNPSQIIVIGGHHDSYSSGNPIILAPGADDNASGTAAVLEMARVIQQSGYRPEVTLKFITFAAEELGLYGSYSFAAKASATGLNIKLMINHDMISNMSNGSGVGVNYYTGCEHIANKAISIVSTYAALAPWLGGRNSSGSDSYSFWQFGFPAVYFEEGEFSPVYHSPNDLITNTNQPYCAEVIKGSLATLISFDQTPSSPNNFLVNDEGDGTHLNVSWSPALESDVVSYKIFVGTASGNYSRSLTSMLNQLQVDNLINGTLYYIGLSSIDSDGNESPIIERSQTPLSVPRTPSAFQVRPLPTKISLSWAKNMEADLMGYNIYRSLNGSEKGNKLNTTTITDTIHLDSTAQNGVYYYYSVSAVDNINYESETTISVRARIVSMDQGLCIIDETKDGDGTLMNPTDSQVDAFYDYLLSDFQTSKYDIAMEGGITLADMGAYSTLIWHGNDVSDIATLGQIKNQIIQYLNYGGNLVLTSYFPSRALTGNNSSTAIFTSGSIIYDYFGIRKAENIFLTRFKGASGINSGYPNIDVDTTKTQSSSNYHLTSIEAIYAAPSAVEIFSYVTRYDTTSLYGKMSGKPVGIENLSASYKVVTLSFPLYYMEAEQAKNLLHHVLVDRFGIQTNVKIDNLNIPSEYSVSQNYPNPFNPTTVFQFQIPNSGLVSINIFDILGREVAILMNEVKPAGTYKVTWNASTLPSGVYFYQVQAGNYFGVKKALLLK